MDDLMLPPVVYLDEGLGAFYWPKQYKKDVGFTALYTADQMREYAKQAVEAYKAADSFCDANCTWADHHADCFRARR